MTLTDTLISLRKANLPAMVFGPPGTGKSAAAKEAAQGDPIIDLRLSMLDTLDMRGMPMPSKDSNDVMWSRPDFLPREGKGILLLDEINTANPSIQNAALQLVLDRRCGPHTLPEGWWVMAAGNYSTDKAAVNPIPAPLLNRFVVLKHEPNLKDWSKWAIQNDIHEDVLGFLNFRESMLYQPPSDVEYNNFPTPRSWASVSKLIHNNIQEQNVFEGTVGIGATIEFLSYQAAKKDLPDLDALIENGCDSLSHIKNTVAYAVSVGLALRVAKNPKLMDKATKVASHLSPELTALYISLVIANNVVVAISNSTIAEWIKNHKHLLI